MKILITGGSGFLGKKLAVYLTQQGHEVLAVSSKEYDLTDSTSLRRLNGDSFDQIYHLAAWTQAGDFCLHHSGEQWIINQQINTNILSWWQRSCSNAKLIAIGTSASYASESDLSEEKYMMGQPNEKFYAYAMTKRMLLVGLQSLHKQFGQDYLYVIPSTLYGPDYHLDDRQPHFIYDLIRKILIAKQTGEPVVLWGDGYQERELIYIDDFVGNLYDLNADSANEIFNIASGKAHTIREFAGIICNIVGYDAKQIRYDEGRYVGARSKVLDISRLSDRIQVRETPLEKGLKQTIDWVYDKYLTK